MFDRFKKLSDLLKLRRAGQQLVAASSLRDVLAIVRDAGPLLVGLTETDVDDKILAALERHADRADRLLWAIDDGSTAHIVAAGAQLLDAIADETPTEWDDFLAGSLSIPGVQSILVMVIDSLAADEAPTEAKIVGALQDVAAADGRESELSPAMWIAIAQGVVWLVKLVRERRRDKQAPAQQGATP